MQSLNGALGSLTAWVGLGATAATTANPQGRLTAAGNAIEGNGTLALGSAFFNLSTDATFLAALDQPINATLAPGVMRYQAWAPALLASRGVSPRPPRQRAQPGHPAGARADRRQPGAKIIDRRKGTAYAIPDAMVLAYAQSACGVTASSKGPRWFSPVRPVAGSARRRQRRLRRRLRDERHGAGRRGSEDARRRGPRDRREPPRARRRSVGSARVRQLHRPVADARRVATLRREEAITFRKNFNVGEIGIGRQLPGRVHVTPTRWRCTRSTSSASSACRRPSGATATSTRGRTACSAGVAPTSAWCRARSLRRPAAPSPIPSGVTLLHEDAHAEGAWADAVAGALSFKQARAARPTRAQLASLRLRRCHRLRAAERDRHAQQPRAPAHHHVRRRSHRHRVLANERRHRRHGRLHQRRVRWALSRCATVRSSRRSTSGPPRHH